MGDLYRNLFAASHGTNISWGLQSRQVRGFARLRGHKLHLTHTFDALVLCFPAWFGFEGD